VLSVLTGSALWGHRMCEPEVRDQMTTTNEPQKCQHVRDLESLIQFGLARGPRASTASMLAATVGIDEKKLACQAECGDRSPYHGVKINPTTREDAIAVLNRPTGYIDVMLEGCASAVRSVCSGVRRALRRS
jgi:hypothetical protein